MKFTNTIEASEGIITAGLKWDRIGLASYGMSSRDDLMVMVYCGYFFYSSNHGGNWYNECSITFDPYLDTWIDICFGNHTFLAVRTSTTGPWSYISVNGKTWVPTNLPANSWIGVAYGGGRFAVVSSSGMVATSTDGIAWQTNTIEGAQFTSICYDSNNKRFVASSAVPLSTNRYLLASTDGLNFTSLNFTNYPNITRIFYKGGRFISIHSDNTCRYSGRYPYNNVGLSYTLNFPVEIQSVEFQNGTYLFVALTKSYTSIDMSKFVETDMGFTQYGSTYYAHTRLFTHSCDGMFFISYPTISGSPYDALLRSGIGWVDDEKPYICRLDSNGKVSDTYINKGVASGVCELDATAKVPLSRLPDDYTGLDITRIIGGSFLMADLNVQIIPKTGPAASLPTEASYGEILVTAENEIYAGGGEGQPLRHLGQGRANELYEVLIEGKLDLNNTTLVLDLNKSPLKLDYN